ncbi:leucine-rich repeat protein [Faecalibacterium prausnitzii]|uniref:leucine-rich repeat protein n=1 Tax=Faecalibacterium prausnitzii TaxID=853 RepID=UPI001C0178B3|nr:leucine-rich repeat protein [Faecalibacterium prausnitzii]MBT9712488.1 leucine-rich repeat protein [Faecalibacterium prausnitzii]
MKKRLLSLLVAISMVLTFLPVSALTAAAAEDSSNGELKIGQNCYPVLDNIPHQTVNEHDIYTGDGWTYDADENCKILTLCPSAPTNYDFFAIHTGHSITTDCNLVIGKNATVTDGNFIASVTNNDTIKGGIFKDAVTNHGTIIGGRFFSSVTNELDGIIENGQFGDWASSYTVTNNGGTINGGTFKEMSSIIGTGSVASGYTLAAETPSVFSSVSVNGYHNSCYIIPNQASVSVDISYRFDDTMYDLPPLDVTIDNAPPTLLSDWCGSDLKIEFDDIRGVYEVTFTAPPANGSTVTISPLTRLVIDKNGYPAVAQDRNGSRANYTGNGWKFDASNNTLTLESGDYDFSGEENALRPLNPNVQLVVESGAKLTGGAAGDGSGVTWQLTENTDDPSTYKLTISGSGAMEDFPFGSYQPWYSFHDQITSVVVSPGVTSIGQCAFSRFAKLTHVDIADSVISIGWDAFYYCSSLTNITIPQSVTYIGPLAFFHCTNLSSITLSNNITSIGSSAFEDCTNLTSITIPGSVTSIGLAAFCNCTKLTSITIPDSVTTIDLEAFKNCSSLTSITIPGSVTSIGSNVFDGCTSLNDIRYSGTSESVISALSDYVPTLVTFNYGDKVPEAERMITVSVKTGETLTAPTTIPTVSGYEFKGWRTKDGKPYDFTVAPTGKFTLYANWEKIPDPKPEPKPDPTPETYTLTVKGGTFTYNGGEAMTSASVPVDAEVKVTLNQSAVPEGMVFDLWAMDEASLLGNPAVAYNQESFTIPAGSVAKGSTVTVEAQYRDATIESEPSILGTAAIIGVAGAGTAVIVWQGYRIGMELYEKYFQPTPEETAVVEPTLEGQMTDPIS